ncbi:hypothetical protein AB1Y20_001025 [Prymnesium parvum]|uniref:Uncharacterized protein n=1 Tax=Prymnesium parvum TaxID=97485 RepID=A0AB34K6J0_PRYPA
MSCPDCYTARQQQRLPAYCSKSYMAPAVFGSYEIGRSKKEKKAGAKSAAFKSESQRLPLELESGDPGEYEPYATTTLAAGSSLTFNKTSKPFGTTSLREFGKNLHGRDTPGPGAYDSSKQAWVPNASSSDFKSGSPQRPNPETRRSPALGTYDPDVSAVKPSTSSGGAVMRGSFNRFKDERVDEPGPGAYESAVVGSLAHDSEQAKKRSSKAKPAFGSTDAKRGVMYRESTSPGPGTYDWDKGKHRDVAGATAAFKSESQRLPLELESGDPGEYEPYATTTLAAGSSLTFNKTSKPFGTTSLREFGKNLHGRDTPGPGAYDSSKQAWVPNASSSDFKSGSPQRPNPETRRSPALGTYDPDVSAVKPSTSSGGAVMRGSFNRFKDERVDEPGPGAYESAVVGSLAHDSEQAKKRSSKAKPAFGSTDAKRGVMYRESTSPGPGTYDWDKGKHRDVAGATAAFKSESQRLPLELESGDPGEYEPYATTTLAAGSSLTFNKTSKPFGTTSLREFGLHGRDTPGPGAYDSSKQAWVPNASSSDFKSGSPQRPNPETRRSPALGTYDPDVSAVKPSTSSGGAVMRGSFNRFKDERVDEPGPGAYESAVVGSLAHDSEQAKKRSSKAKPAFGSTDAKRGVMYRESTSPGPGTYDWDKGKHRDVAGATAAFKSESQRLPLELESGDPGEYEPYATTTLAAGSSLTFNKTSKPFGTTSLREFGKNLHGRDTPGPGAYDSSKQAWVPNASSSDFKSGSPQRPNPETRRSPALGTYDPDVSAVKPSTSSGGAVMRGSFNRFKDERVDEPGPGAYESAVVGSLAYDSEQAKKRSSKAKPAFGSTGSSREACFSKELLKFTVSCLL